jgi:hypothetical protein
MSTSRLLWSLISLAALAGSAGAGAQALPSTQGELQALPEVLPEIRVLETMPRHAIKLEEARAVRGVYDMSNGWLLEISPNFRRVYADLNRSGPVELLKVSEDKFISTDGRMAMQFNLNGNENEMLMRYTPPNSVAAHSIVLTSRLAQR